LHPAIDTAIRLRDENKLTADQIERLELKVHPLVLELTGKNSPCFSLSSDIGVLNDYALDLVERNLIAGPIVEFRRTRPFVRRHCLAAFEGTGVVEIGCDPRCAERVTADFGSRPASLTRRRIMRQASTRCIAELVSSPVRPRAERNRGVRFASAIPAG